MSKSRNQKLRILCLLNILRRETDTAHPMPVKDMLLQLEERGIRAERKAVYDDIRALVEYGIDIESIPGKGYYINTRDYELAELKTLADIILAAKFLTAKKSDHLIRKLCRETSKYSEAELNRQICVSRVKAPNETIYYTVDALHTAIRDNRQVSFRYYHFDENKNLIERRRNQQYVVSPWALLWDDENYYLISYSAEAKDIRHYRVDRMGNVDILRAQREGEERFHNFDAGVYGQKMFGMFGGEETIVTLRCKNEAAGAIIDRFGIEPAFIKRNDGTFDVSVRVFASPQFFAWIFGLDGLVRIVSPDNIIREFLNYLQKISAAHTTVP